MSIWHNALSLFLVRTYRHVRTLTVARVAYRDCSVVEMGPAPPLHYA
jgi:hypothetical protein